MPRRSTAPVSLTLKIHWSTSRALFVSQTEDEDDAEWIPLSQIEVENEDPEVFSIREITMPEWLAQVKGFI